MAAAALPDKTGISASNLIIMSGSEAVIVDNVGGVLNAPGAVTFAISDLRNQPMPAGTTVSVSVTNGRLIGPTSYTMPCTSVNGPVNFTFNVDADTNATATGLMIIEVETPRGVQTIGSITVND